MVDVIVNEFMDIIVCNVIYFMDVDKIVVYVILMLIEVVSDIDMGDLVSL